MGAFGKFQQLITDIVPWYMRQQNVATFLEAIGLVLDGAHDGLLTGLRLSQPLRCIPEAFPALSKDRKVRLYPNETEASKRYRLAHWRQLRRTWGCHYGEMFNVQPYFLPGVPPTIHIVHQSGGGSPVATWHKMTAAGVYAWSRATPSNFNYDGQTSKWSRWGVFLDMSGTGIAPPNTYDDGHTYDDGARYDVGMPGGLPYQSQLDLVQMFRDVKAAHSWLMFVALDWTGTIDPAGTPIQDASGWWSLPNGKWGRRTDPTTGLGTRPPMIEWIYDVPG